MALDPNSPYYNPYEALTIEGEGSSHYDGTTKGKRKNRRKANNKNKVDNFLKETQGETNRQKIAENTRKLAAIKKQAESETDVIGFDELTDEQLSYFKSLESVSIKLIAVASGTAIGTLVGVYYGVSAYEAGEKLYIAPLTGAGSAAANTGLSSLTTIDWLDKAIKWNFLDKKEWSLKASLVTVLSTGCALPNFILGWNALKGSWLQVPVAAATGFNRENINEYAFYAFLRELTGEEDKVDQDAADVRRNIFKLLNYRLKFIESEQENALTHLIESFDNDTLTHRKCMETTLITNPVTDKQFTGEEVAAIVAIIQHHELGQLSSSDTGDIENLPTVEDATKLLQQTFNINQQGTQANSQAIWEVIKDENILRHPTKEADYLSAKDVAALRFVTMPAAEPFSDNEIEELSQRKHYSTEWLTTIRRLSLVFGATTTPYLWANQYATYNFFLEHMSETAAWYLALGANSMSLLLSIYGGSKAFKAIALKMFAKQNTRDTDFMYTKIASLKLTANWLVSCFSDKKPFDVPVRMTSGYLTTSLVIELFTHILTLASTATAVFNIFDDVPGICKDELTAEQCKDGSYGDLNAKGQFFWWSTIYGVYMVNSLGVFKYMEIFANWLQTSEKSFTSFKELPQATANAFKTAIGKITARFKKEQPAEKTALINARVDAMESQDESDRHHDELSTRTIQQLITALSQASDKDILQAAKDGTFESMLEVSKKLEQNPELKDKITPKTTLGEFFKTTVEKIDTHAASQQRLRTP